MTVRELIKELEKEDQNAPVYLDDCGFYTEVTGIDTLVHNGKEMIVIE